MYKNYYQKNSYEDLYYSQLEKISNLENENKKLKELLDLNENHDVDVISYIEEICRENRLLKERIVYLKRSIECNLSNISSALNDHVIPDRDLLNSRDMLSKFQDILFEYLFNLNGVYLDEE